MDKIYAWSIEFFDMITCGLALFIEWLRDGISLFIYFNTNEGEMGSWDPSPWGDGDTSP